MLLKRIFVIVAFVILMQPAFAHGPSKIKLSLDAETHVLNVEILHKVRNGEGHFIEWVKVFLNGEEIILQTIGLQPAKEGVKVLYKIPELKDGDEIKVTAKCNKIGKKSAKLTFKKVMNESR